MPQRYFADTSDDSHDDFKPKIKVELDEDKAHEVIKDYISENDIVLFMKGTS